MEFPLSPKWDLVFGLVALGLAVDKIFVRPRDLPFDYLWLLISFGYLARFGWVTWKRREGEKVRR